MKGLRIKHAFTDHTHLNRIVFLNVRSLVEITRYLLIEANLLHNFCEEAIMTKENLLNRLPTKTNCKTAFELSIGEKPDLSNIRTFGYRAYIYKRKKIKLEENSVECILLEYDKRNKGDRIY